MDIDPQKTANGEDHCWDQGIAFVYRLKDWHILRIWQKMI